MPAAESPFPGDIRGQERVTAGRGGAPVDHHDWRQTDEQGPAYGGQGR